MSNLTIATTFIIILNVLMWFSSAAMLDINPDATICFNKDNSVINSYMNNGTLNNDPLNDLPSSNSGDVSGGSSSGFGTDLFNTLLGWITDIPGVKYITGVIKAPMNILNCMGLPQDFANGIGVLWYMLSILVMVAWLAWRD